MSEHRTGPDLVCLFSSFVPVNTFLTACYCQLQTDCKSCAYVNLHLPCLPKNLSCSISTESYGSTAFRV